MFSFLYLENRMISIIMGAKHSKRAIVLLVCNNCVYTLKHQGKYFSLPFFVQKIIVSECLTVFINPQSYKIPVSTDGEKLIISQRQTDYPRNRTVSNDNPKYLLSRLLHLTRSRFRQRTLFLFRCLTQLKTSIEQTKDFILLTFFNQCFIKVVWVRLIV